MPLDPQVKQLLEHMERVDPRPSGDWTIRQTREKYLQMRTLAGEPKILERIEDRTIRGPEGDLPIRLYASRSEDKLPALVYLHGGRFISGNLETHDAVCRDLAFRSGCLIIAVDYRLAPEHPFPAALEDSFCVTSWAASEGDEVGIDTTRVAVGGDSAGGNLAASVALMARDKPGPRLACQLLIYPMLDATCGAETHRTIASGYGAGSEDMKQGYREYLADEVDPRSPLVSPLLVENVAGLPTAFILTAEYDCLRDEAELYAGRLRSAGVVVRQARYEGAIHGFFQMAGILNLGERALGEAADYLRDVLGR